MKDLAFIQRFVQPARLYIEIGLDSFRVLQENESLELPIERETNGRLTEECRGNLAGRLKAFVNRQKWQLPASAYCAICGIGVSLRRVALPPAAKKDWHRLLSLQIETEFPISPEELAWGYLALSEPPVNGVAARQEFLVAAMRKDVLEEYSSLLAGCGISPVFTLAGLARGRFCPKPAGHSSILDLDRERSEWTILENNVPVAIRIFHWGTENSTATETALDALARSIRTHGKNGTIFMTGAGDQWQLAASAAGKLGNGNECRWIEAETKSGRSAAVLGLRQWAEVDGGTPPLVLRTGPGPAKGLAGKLGNFDLSDPVLRERAALAVVLFLALLVLPYAQAFLLKPFVAHKVAVIQSHQDRLTTIDHELNFLQYLKQNSPPYLDTLYLFAQAAPPGTSFDSLTMNEHGEVSMSGSMGGFQQVAEFRAKLIQSGFFSNVSVQEQAPAQFPQKVNVRMTAQWKPATARAQLKIGPTADEIAQVGKEPRTSGNGAAGIGPRPAHAGHANSAKPSEP
jgi:hypothetical protein